MKQYKTLKTTAAIALGVSALATTVAPGTVSAAQYKLNAKKQLVKTSTGKVAKGNVVYKGKLYKNGKLAKAKKYTLVGSGSNLQLFYGSTLKKGSKTASNKTYLFKDGKLAKGIIQAGAGERLYENGKLSKGYDVVTDKNGEKSLYQNGYLKKGLKTAKRDGVTQLYKDGKLADGAVVFKNVLYTAGSVSKGLVEHEGTFYNNGKLANGELDGAEFTNGVVTATKEVVTLKKETVKTAEAQKALTDAVATKDEAKIEAAAQALVAQAAAQATAAQAVAEKATTTAGVESAQAAIKAATQSGEAAVEAAKAAGKTVDAKALDAAVEAATKAVDANTNKPVTPEEPKPTEPTDPTPTDPETPSTGGNTGGNTGGTDGGTTTPAETDEEKALKAVAAGTATAAQYKALTATEADAATLNAYFKATQEGTAGATVQTAITKAVVKAQAEALVAATEATLEATDHADATYVKYTPAAEADWDFSAAATGAKAIVDGDKAWFNNGAVNKAKDGEWQNVGTVEQGITNDAEATSKAYNVKKTAVAADKVVYVLTSEGKWVKVTLKAETFTSNLAKAKKALETAIEAVVVADYTDEAKATEAVAAAQAVLDNAATTEAGYKAATDALATAIEGLETKKAAAQAKLDTAEITKVAADNLTTAVQAQAATNASLTTVKTEGDVITLTGDLAAYEEITSSNTDQGTAKFIALDINTGFDDIKKVAYNDVMLTEDDVNEAASISLGAGHFVLWVKAEELTEKPKVVTLTVDGAEKTFTVKFVDTEETATKETAKAFQDKYKDLLAKETVTLADKEKTNEAVTEYAALAAEVQALLTEEKSTLDAFSATLADLQFINDVRNAKTDTTVTLTKDMTLTDELTVKNPTSASDETGLIIPAGVTVDGAGHTITVNTTAKANNLSGIGLSNGATLKNVTVKMDDSKKVWADWKDNLVEVLANSNVTLENVAIKNGTQAGLTLLSESKATLKGAITLENNAWGGIEIYKDANVTIDQDATINYTAAALGKPFAWVDAAVATEDVANRLTAKTGLLTNNLFVKTTSTGDNVQHFWNITDQVADTQEKAMTAAGAHTMAVDADKVTFTFANDLPAEAITNTENFLNEVVQFQLSAVYRIDNTLVKIDKVAATDAKLSAAKLSEVDNLTTAEVSTMLAKERTEGTTITSTEFKDVGGWSTTIDWSKVQVKQGANATEIVMTINPELITAADLKDADKINSTNFATSGYNITFYKKDDTTKKYKISLAPSQDKTQAIATFVTVAPKN